MRTLAIETGIESKYENALIASAKKAGWNVVKAFNIPFTDRFINQDTYKDLPKEFLENSEVFFHGSIKACQAAQKVSAWKVDANWDELKCSYYYDKLSGLILQEEHIFTTIGEMKSGMEKLYGLPLVRDGCLFFRPDGNDKIFKGGCIHFDEFDEKYELVTFYDPDDEASVVVAKPQKILSEARFIVICGIAVTGSYYRTGGQTVRVKASDDLIELAQDFVDKCGRRDFFPSTSWILDLAETPDGWSIIEVGASSCCGLYECDTDIFISDLNCCW